MGFLNYLQFYVPRNFTARHPRDSRSKSPLNLNYCASYELILIKTAPAALSIFGLTSAALENNGSF
ncbi:hypothetical protein SFRURICE_010911 [Spodoptera frugiperda]|nr:hypothetical protein SFRURICE_010911 [Spodoptera frugiperda]